MYISLHTMEQFNKALLVLHQCQTITDFVTQTMQTIRRLIPYENGAYFPVNPLSEFDEMPLSVDLDNRLFRDYRDYYQQYDRYRMTVFRQQPIPLVDRASDYMNFADWGKNEHRAEFLLPSKMYFLAGLQLFYDGALAGEISIHRLKRQGDFDDTTFYLLQMLAGHLQIIFSRIKDLESKDVMTVLLNQLRRRYGLTKREMEILRFLAKGFSNKQIGNQLFISAETVKTHLRSLFYKTKTSSRAELLGQLIVLSNHSDL
jgi:DNA-binding CsgD family transcriptional regulator